MVVSRPSNARAVQLRQRQTDVERRLWLALRDRRLCGAKFRRQVPIGRYVVDFLCPDARLVVEIDGGQHGGPEDIARQLWLESQGYRVLRFWNNDVSSNFGGVLANVATALERPSPAPSHMVKSPLPLAGEGGVRVDSQAETLVCGTTHPHPDLLPPAGEGAAGVGP